MRPLAVALVQLDTREDVETNIIDAGKLANEAAAGGARFIALRTALSAKAAEGKLIVVDAATLAEPKTAKLKGHFGKLGVSSVLVIAGAEVDKNFAKAAANIAHVDVLPQQGANVYDILRRDTLVLTKDAVKHLEERLQ